MKPTLYLITITFLFSSCATLLSSKRQRIVLYTKKPGAVIYNQDTIPTLKNEARLRVERKNEIVKLLVIDGNSKKSLTLYPHISTTFWLNLLFNDGLGMLVDMWTPKTWAYPTKIHPDNYDSVNYRRRYEISHNQGRNSLKSYFAYNPPRKKGEIYLHAAIPFVNQYYLIPQNESRKNQTDLLGGSIGLDYYHADNRFLSLYFTHNDAAFNNVAMDRFISYITEKQTSDYVSLSNNHLINRLSIGYGIVAARNNWNAKYYQVDRDTLSHPAVPYVNKSYYTFGLIVPVYFQLTNNFYTGLLYRPTFYRPNLPDKFKYEHLLSVDFAWKFRIKK